MTLALAIFSVFLCGPILAGIALLMAQGRRGSYATATRACAFTCLGLWALVILAYMMLFAGAVASEAAR